MTTRYRALRVLPVVEDQNIAAQHLIRPDEASDFARRICDVLYLPTTATIPQAVGLALRANFSTGGFKWVADQVDSLGRDLWRSPALTLEQRAGDCEDWALLALSLLLWMGARAWLVIGYHAGERHAWVEGVDEGGRWFLLEATNGAVFYDHRPAIYYADHAFGRGWHRAMAA